MLREIFGQGLSRLRLSTQNPVTVLANLVSEKAKDLAYCSGMPPYWN